MKHLFVSPTLCYETGLNAALTYRMKDIILLGKSVKNEVEYFLFEIHSEVFLRQISLTALKPSLSRQTT